MNAETEKLTRELSDAKTERNILARDCKRMENALRQIATETCGDPEEFAREFLDEHCGGWE
jgi:hypothetical protein